MDYDFDNMTIEEIRQDIFKFRNDINTQRIDAYYSAPSYSEILGVSRRELSHSNFLAWILDDQESHSLSYFPIKKFLEILVSYANEEQFSNNKALFNAIVTDDISLSNLTIEREVGLGKFGRLDLYAEMKATLSNNDEYRVKIIVENKVKSNEHSDQTKKYFDYFEANKNPNDINLFVFLTPLSGIDLIELIEPECACKEFIQINYQALVDSMFQPILNKNITEKTKMVIQDYLQSLSQPSIDMQDDYKQGLIMAIGNEERELLTKFWEKNKKLILAALSAMSSDPDQEKDERDNIKDAIGKISNSTKDRSLYSIFFNDENQVSKIRKSDIGYETVRTLDKHNLIDEEMFNFLREDKTCSFQLLKMKEEVTENEEKYSKYRIQNDPELIYLDTGYYVARNWGARNTGLFTNKITDKIPNIKYDIHS